MEISGQRISLPRNFLFLNRLPARFEILVIAKGATLPKGTAFEVEIQGQRLVLQSKIELKAGARYDLEKISALEFKILAEKGDDSREKTDAGLRTEPQRKQTNAESTGFFIPDTKTTAQDLLALKVLADSGRRVSANGDKYLFSLESEVDLSGVFVPQTPGRYRLFVSGHGIQKDDLEKLSESLSALGIDGVRHVTPAVLARISAGAVDIRT
jgi:hypothetical protein